jgi:hypothetical protein
MIRLKSVAIVVHSSDVTCKFLISSLPSFTLGPPFCRPPLFPSSYLLSTKTRIWMKQNLTFLQGDILGSLIWSTLEVNLSIACACVAVLKPFANRFFPKLLGKLSSGGNNDNGTYPCIPGKGSKPTNGNSVLASEQGFRSGGFGEEGGGSYKMQSYCQTVEVRQHIATVKGGRDVDGSSSQESIIGEVEPFPQDDEERGMGVYVTRMVHVH